MNDEAVYRTAPATPGLLIIGSHQFTLHHHQAFFSVWQQFYVYNFRILNWVPDQRGITDLHCQSSKCGCKFKKCVL